MPDLAVILVTHNSSAWLRPFAESWQASAANWPARSPLAVEFIIADAGSSDDSRQIAAALFPDARILPLDNIGYGAAINRAAEITHSPFLLLCNPDLTFPVDFAMKFLLPVIECGEERRAWAHGHVFAPRLVNTDGSAQASVGRFPSIWTIMRDQFRRREARKYQWPQPTAASPVEWASGACLLISREVFRKIEGFDEKFFLYVEEVDFQRRLSDAGHATYFVPEATVVHHNPNASRPPRAEIDRYTARGMLRYFAKHSMISLFFFRFAALVAGRLPAREAFIFRRTILNKSTRE